jgi:hypothetical protein
VVPATHTHVPVPATHLSTETRVGFTLPGACSYVHQQLLTGRATGIFNSIVMTRLQLLMQLIDDRMVNLQPNLLRLRLLLL